MKTIFKEGMKVYDSVFFPKSEGEVVKIEKKIDCERVIVQFDCLDYELSYTERGLLTSTHSEATPTLSTSPYTFDGFEQKAPVPTYEEALKEAQRKGDYYYQPYHLEVPSKELAKATMALLKLLFLRDYYNEGWQPDWNNRQRDKFGIMVDKNMLCKESFQSNNKPLAFKSREILDRFFEEQRELLEIAKPLL